MDLTEDEVLQILKLLDESDFDHLHLEVGDLKLIVSKNGPAPEAVQTAATVSSATAAPAAAAKPAEAPRAAAKSEPAPKAAAEVVVEAGTVPIKAPLLGTFYSRPEPSAPPYVEVGKSVNPDDTVGLIEVMKLFTSVKAGVQGKVNQVCVQSGQMVEYGQILFLVKPEDQ